MSDLLERPHKTSRIDVRMEPARKAAYEEAARLSGLSLSQWALRNLDEAAMADIEAARALSLAQEEFDKFCEALDAPAPSALKEFLAKEPTWAD